MRTPTISADGIDLFTRAIGDPAAHLVQFLPKFPEYSGAWDELLPAFAQRYGAVVPEQRLGPRRSRSAGSLRAQAPGARSIGLGDRPSLGWPFSLLAHDWGPVSPTRQQSRQGNGSPS